MGNYDENDYNDGDDNTTDDNDDDHNDDDGAVRRDLNVGDDHDRSYTCYRISRASIIK